MTELGLNAIWDDVWNILPKKIALIFAVTIILALIGAFFLGGFRNLLSYLHSLMRDSIYALRLYLVNRNEIKRIETLINWKKNSLKNKSNFDSSKVKVRNVFIKDEEDAFIDAAKKGSVVVIKKRLEENKSRNLSYTVTNWVILDYLASIRKYLSPELTTALTNKTIINMLREMKDYEAERMFIKATALNNKVANFITKLDSLESEGIFDNLYIPYLKKLKLFLNSIPKATQKESEDLIDWFIDYKQRLRVVSPFKYFPRTTFLYVRLPTTPIGAHITRALTKFEKDGCELLVVSGWNEQKKSVFFVSKKLKVYSYPVLFTFEGERERETKTGSVPMARVNYVHSKKGFKLY